MLFDFEKLDDDELQVHAGEIVCGIEKVDENWWEVKSPLETGLVPTSYVEELDEVEALEYVRLLGGVDGVLAQFAGDADGNGDGVHGGADRYGDGDGDEGSNAQDTGNVRVGVAMRLRSASSTNEDRVLRWVRARNKNLLRVRERTDSMYSQGTTGERAQQPILQDILPRPQRLVGTGRGLEGGSGAERGGAGVSSADDALVAKLEQLESELERERQLRAFMETHMTLSGPAVEAVAVPLGGRLRDDATGAGSPKSPPLPRYHHVPLQVPQLAVQRAESDLTDESTTSFPSPSATSSLLVSRDDVTGLDASERRKVPKTKTQTNAKTRSKPATRQAASSTLERRDSAEDSGLDSIGVDVGRGSTASVSVFHGSPASDSPASAALAAAKTTESAAATTTTTTTTSKKKKKRKKPKETAEHAALALKLGVRRAAEQRRSDGELPSDVGSDGAGARHAPGLSPDHCAEGGGHEAVAGDAGTEGEDTDVQNTHATAAPAEAVESDTSAQVEKVQTPTTTTKKKKKKTTTSTKKKEASLPGSPLRPTVHLGAVQTRTGSGTLESDGPLLAQSSGTTMEMSTTTKKKNKKTSRGSTTKMTKKEKSISDAPGGQVRKDSSSGASAAQEREVVGGPRAAKSTRPAAASSIASEVSEISSLGNESDEE